MECLNGSIILRKRLSQKKKSFSLSVPYINLLFLRRLISLWFIIPRLKNICHSTFFFFRFRKIEIIFNARLMYFNIYRLGFSSFFLMLSSKKTSIEIKNFQGKYFKGKKIKVSSLGEGNCIILKTSQKKSFPMS